MNLDDFIGPYYNSKACVIFQILAIIMILGIITYVSLGIYLTYKKKLGFDASLNILITSGSYLMFYYLYRLAYGICLNNN